jgi:hypothetical protein
LADTGFINCTALWAAEKRSNVNSDILYCLLLQKVHPDGEIWWRIGIAIVGVPRPWSAEYTGDYRTDWIWEQQELKII